MESSVPVIIYFLEFFWSVKWKSQVGELFII